MLLRDDKESVKIVERVRPNPGSRMGRMSGWFVKSLTAAL